MAGKIGYERGGEGAYRRKGAERFVRGAASYVDDVQLPDAAYAAFVRSAAARAKIKNLDLQYQKRCTDFFAAIIDFGSLMS